MLVMRQMQINRYGQLWRALPLLVCAGLLITLSNGSAAVPAQIKTAHAPPAAADLAIQFEALLGQHSVLAADLMRSRIRGDDDFVQAANAALGKNTEAMTALVGEMFGAATAEKFGPMWSEHIVALFAYAGGLAAQDEKALAEARDEITEYEEELGNFFAAASHGRLSKAAAEEAVAAARRTSDRRRPTRTRSDDYAAADALYRMGYQHTYDLGPDPGRRAAAGRRTRPLCDQPIWRLRSQLGKLLAEHAVLVEDVTRAAVTNTPDFTASGQMINGNTRDLTSRHGQPVRRGGGQGLPVAVGRPRRAVGGVLRGHRGRRRHEAGRGQDPTGHDSRSGWPRSWPPRPARG